MIEIIVNGQEIRKQNDLTLVAGAVNYIQLKTTFDSSWNGLNISYQFKNGDRTYQVESNDLIITVPQEVIKEGTLTISIKGTRLLQNGELEVKATSGPVSYIVYKSELIENPTNTESATPTIIEQIRNIAEEAKEIAEEINESIGGEFKWWSGTQVEYDAIIAKEDDRFYFIEEE